MGFTDLIKGLFKRDKEVQAASVAKGTSVASNVSMVGLDPSSSGSEGVGALQNQLAIEQDLVSRYIDYENMDDYVETCLAGDSLVFTVERGWVRIQELAETREEFHVLAYDRELRSLVPAKGCDARLTGASGHKKPMVRVTLDDGREIRCTSDHLFMRKDGTWVEAASLSSGDRMMPGIMRLRSLDSAEATPYWQVHQPHHDSVIEGGRKDRQQRWVWIHRLVAQIINGDKGSAHVHHVDGDPLNNSPGNLKGVSLSEHAHCHIAHLDNSNYFPKWTDEMRVAMGDRMRGNTYRRGTIASEESRRKMSEARRGRSKGEEWRRKIGLSQPNRIDLSREEVESALESGGSVAEAARILGVSWSKAKRSAVEYDLLSDNGNHRVVSVDVIEGGEAVYDLTVPGYANFVCNGVVVHNSIALDVYADDSTIPDTINRRTVWATSEDKLIRDILNDMLHRMVRIDEDVWVSVRNLGKYGNLYAEPLVTKGGLIGLNWLPAPSVRRIVNTKGMLLGFIQDVTGQFNYDLEALIKALEEGKTPIPEGEGKEGVVFFHPWELIHWRLRSKQIRSPYGYGILDSSRWIWKRLQLMEDTALVQKLTRAPGRYAFYVDTGDLPPREAVALVRKVKSGFKKKRLIDPTTGQLDLRNNPLCLAGDTEVPLLDGSKKTIVEMAEAFDRGEEQWVYGVDRKNDSKIVPGKVVWAGQTRKDAELVRVTLDNGESFRVTPDHKCILRSGELRDAQDLVPGESLMPLRRSISSFEKGDAMDGYEKVYDPSSKKYVYTHRMVVRELGMREKGRLTHHNAGKLNNDPNCLESMTWREHSEHHCKLGQIGGARIKELRKTDKVLDQKLRDAASRTLKKCHADPEWKKRNAEGVRRCNIERDSGKYIRVYNASDKHAEDNAQRSCAMKAFWTDDNRAEYSEMRTISYSDVFVSALEEFVRSNPGSSADDVADFVSGDPAVLGLLNEGSCRVIEKAHRHLLLKAYRAHGYSGFSEFKEAACSYNHKVVSVERLSEREDTYTLTVDSCHNFGLSSGVIVCNSPSEDFWIPTRGGKDSTRIEVISGPDVQMMDDVEYFQGKLVTSTKVPRRYMGLGDPGDTTNVMASQDDVRFARACMRVQREYIQGLRKAARIHLAALNIDPDSVPWDINMTVPSAIFEMQQIEIMNSQAGLAASLADYMSKPWILQRVFNMSKDEAQTMIQAKRDEESGDIIRDADAQAKVLKLYPELEGALDDGKGAEESVAPKGSLFSEDDSEKMLRSVNKRVHAIERGIVRLNKTTRINASGKQRRQ